MPNRRAAASCLAASIALIVAAGVLGPSAAQPPLPQRRPWLPPYWITTDPSPWLITALLLTAIGLGAAGLWLGLRSLGRGWRPDPRRLGLAGIAAAALMILVPPMGSADVLVYAAYGRIASLGGDPYTRTAAELAATGDPIGRAVEAPWQHTASIYGPLTTAEQWLAARIGAGSTHATVFVLALLGAIAFVATGRVLDRLARTAVEPDLARARVGLLWSVNPLLLYGVVKGAHIDALGILLAVTAIAVLARSALLAGIAAGLAFDVKLSFGLVALALAWALRRTPRRLAQLATGGLLAVGIGYAWTGLHALDQASAAARFVSFASPWRLLVGPLEAVFDDRLARNLIATLAWLAFALLAFVLARALPPATAGAGDPTAAAIRAFAVLGLAWLLTATYSLPWYDVVGWAPFTLLAASRWDGLLLARTTALSAGYLPGRVIPLPAPLGTLTRHLRGAVAPVVGITLIGLAVRWRSPRHQRQKRQP